MAGRSSVRVCDKRAEETLLKWLEECDSDGEDEEYAIVDSDDEGEEDTVELQSEYDSENFSDAEHNSSENDNFYM